MMHTPFYSWKSFAYWVSGGLLFLSSFMLLLLTTQPGLLLSSKIATCFLPGTVHLEGLSGRLIDHIEIKKFKYEDDSVKVHAQQLSLSWDFKALFKKRLIINHIRADKMRLQQLSPSTATKTAHSLALPSNTLPISIHTLTVHSLTWNEHPLFKQLKVNLLEWNANHFSIQQLRFNALHHQLQSTVQLSTFFPYPLKGMLHIRPLQKFSQTGDFPKQSIQGSIQLSGDQFAYHLQGKLTKPGLITLDGELKKGQVVSVLLHWQKVQWKLNQSMLYSPAGHLHASGTPPHLLIQAQGNLKTPLEAQFKTDIQTAAQKVHALNIITIASHPPVEVKVDWQQPQIAINATYGKNILQLSGEAVDKWQINALIPEPSIIYPDLKGLNTTLRLQGKVMNAQEGHLTLMVDPGRWQFKDHMLDFKSGSVKASLNPQGLSAHTDLSINENIALTSELFLPQFNYLNPDKTQPLQGQINLSFASLSFLNTLYPDIKNINGLLKAHFAVAGKLSAPTIKGKLSLTEGSFTVLPLNLHAGPVKLLLKSEGHTWEAKGRIAAHNQTLFLTGSGQFSPEMEGVLQLKGQNFLIMNTDEYHIVITPDVQLAFKPGQLSIQGNIVVPSALISPQTFTDSVSLSEDAVFMQKKKEAPSLTQVNTDITISMGNQVKLAVKGLMGRLNGSVHLQQTTPSPLIASGELHITEGKYQAYGQNLVISEGNLVFTGGSVENPGISLRAARQFNNATDSFSGSNKLLDFGTTNLQSQDFSNKTTVGIEVTGRLKTPKVQLFSIPGTLSQADILSLLLLGKPANQANKSGAQLLLTAISALNLNSGTKGLQLLSQLKSSLGLDLDIQNTSQYNQKTNQMTDGTAFVVGKSLSPRLYLSYNMGLSQNDSNMLTLKYLLNKFFSIQVNASVNSSGIDILYTRQKD